MKIKLCVLLFSTIIGVNSFALDLVLNGYERIDAGSSVPLLITDRFYSNRDGVVFEIKEGELVQLYDLNDSLIISINGNEALGYMKNINSEKGLYYRCNVSECSIENERQYFSEPDYFLYNQTPALRSWQNMISGHGESIVVSKSSQNSEVFTFNIIGESGLILDSFDTEGVLVNSLNLPIRYPVATTGITSEKEFKLLTSSHGSYSMIMKVWDDTNKRLVDRVIYDKNGNDLNASYPTGLAPIAISEPFYGASDTKYKIAFASLVSLDSATVSQVFVSTVIVDSEGARLQDVPTPAGAPTSYNIHGNLTTTPTFFLLPGMNLATQSGVSIHSEGVKLDPSIYGYSNGGNLIVKENLGNYYIYRDSQLCN